MKVDLDIDPTPVPPRVSVMDIDFDQSATIQERMWGPTIVIRISDIDTEQAQEIMRRLVGMPGFPGEEAWVGKADALPALPTGFQRRMDIE